MTRNATGNVLSECSHWLTRFVVLSPAQIAVLAVWILHTWALEAAEFTPYLHITSPEKGCGKTLLLSVLETLVCNPWFTGRVSSAVLVRKVDKEHPTLLLDESDAAFKGPLEYGEVLRGILNAGYARNGKYSICVGKDHSCQDFSCFGPKAIAGIGKIPDTVASRSIVIEMQRKTREQTVERFRRLVREQSKPIQTALKAWANKQTIQALRNAMPVLPDALSDRQQDVTEPLLAIADIAGGEYRQQLEAALITLFRSDVAEDDSLGARLLEDIRQILDSQSLDSIFSSELASQLCDIEGSPWKDWAHGKGLEANRLARQLKPFHITPRTLRIGGETRKGYTRSDFADAWARYGPALPPFIRNTVTTRMASEDSASFDHFSESSVTNSKMPGEQPNTRTVTAVTVPWEQIGTKAPRDEFEEIEL